MGRVKVSKRQSLLDVAIQKSGLAHAAFEIAKANGLAITDMLQPGQTIEIPEILNADMVRYYRGKGIKPETAEMELPAEYDRLFEVEFFEEFE